MKKIAILILLLLIVLILTLGGLFWWVSSGMAVNPGAIAEKNFVVVRGEGVGSISGRLQEQGLIKSALRLKIYLYLNREIGNKIQAGNFTLSPGLSTAKIASTLTRGTNDQKVTIIEGLRQEEIGLQLIESGFDINFGEWYSEVLRQNLEGKLFPDTYLIPLDASLTEILTIFANNYQKRVIIGTSNAITGSIKFSENDFLILASLVEREARSDTSRPIVAGIIIKRLEAGWPLQVDASVQYAAASRGCLSQVTNRQAPNVDCNWWKNSLTQNDLQVKSEYNTYLNRGLPPTPICNPSLSAIKAVLNPIETDYWFYITGVDNQMHYAKTIEEHNLNIKRYL